MASPAVLKRNINLAHARQLAKLQLPSERDTRREDPPSDLLTKITGWITDNPGAIQAAQDSQCASTGPDSPNWDAVLLSLVETSALLLRKYPEVIKAAEAAHKGDLEQATDHLERAQEDINTVAALLNCTFLQLCDFLDQAPDGSPSLAGAFCGRFISNNKEKPYMGVAYKGTSTEPEKITDLLWAPITPLRPDVAWGAPMHAGWYQGLFGTFTTEGTGPQVPFDLMLQTLSDAYAAHPNALLHFTGHSLGGVYSTITYGEFLRRQAEPAFAKFNFGDLYSLASPRFCLQPFATEFNAHTSQTPGGGKYSFRVVNMQDPIPTLPPAFKEQVEQFPFVHSGRAWVIKNDGPPEKMDDEPPAVYPESLDQVLLNAKYHDNNEYYISWQQTPHS